MCNLSNFKAGDVFLHKFLFKRQHVLFDVCGCLHSTVFAIQINSMCTVKSVELYFNICEG